MKTDTVRYVELSELKSRKIRAPRKNGYGFWYVDVITVYQTDCSETYLLVKGCRSSGAAYKVALSDCRDACGRRYEVLRGKRVSQ